MSKYGKGIINRLHPLSPLHDEENEGHKVIDNTIGEYLDRYEARDLAHQLFILHATGKFLDLHGEERGIIRKTGESDDAYRARILLEKGMYNCIKHFRQFGVDFWDYVDDFAEGSQDFFIQLFDETRDYKINNKVTITVRNLSNDNLVDYDGYTDEFGIARFNIPLNNISSFSIIAHGDDEYNDTVATMTRSNNVSWKKNTLLICNDSDIIRHSKFKVKLVTSDGTICSNKKVIISVNGISYDKITDNEGYAKLNINLLEGDYIVSYEFKGDDDLNPSYGNITIHDFSVGANKKNLLIDVGLINDLSSTSITSKNTYLNNEYFAHGSVAVQRKLKQKFINKGVTWF